MPLNSAALTDSLLHLKSPLLHSPQGLQQKIYNPKLYLNLAQVFNSDYTYWLNGIEILFNIKSYFLCHDVCGFM